MTAAARTIELARQLHQSGRWKDAETLYLQALDASPGEADGLHLLGLLHAETGRPDTATQLLLAGVPDAHVAQILGHTNTAMLHRHYGHLSKFMKPLADALDSVVNKAANGGGSSGGKAGAAG